MQVATTRNHPPEAVLLEALKLLANSVTPQELDNVVERIVELPDNGEPLTAEAIRALAESESARTRAC